MEKFEKILSFFIKNPYIHIQLSKEFLNSFRENFFIQLILLPIIMVILLSISISVIITTLKFDLFIYYHKLAIFLYFYIFIFLFGLIYYFFILIRNYFHLKYRLLSIKSFYIKYIFYFTILLQLFSLSLIFTIKGIQPITIYLYYLTAIILFIIYYFYYKKRWQKNIFIDNYIKYKKEIFKLNFPENSLNGKFQLDLKESKKEKPIFTKIWELLTMIILRFGLTLPVLASVFGSGNIKNYDATIYFCVYIFMFMIPVFAKGISSQVVFYKFIKQIEKEENVTIYNGKLKTLDSENK
ncbi:hypothetical protein SAMN06295997_1166 [Malaciobacter marinus]|nr:hypothetical protein SAMN06295997_1166 [Malaciobacter marinus]